MIIFLLYFIIALIWFYLFLKLDKKYNDGDLTFEEGYMSPVIIITTLMWPFALIFIIAFGPFYLIYKNVYK